MPWIKCTGYANFANNIGKETISRVMAFIRSESDLLAVSYSKKYFSFVANASENQRYISNNNCMADSNKTALS